MVVCCELLKRSREDGTEYPEWPWQGKKGKSVVSYTHCYCRVTAHHHDITWSYVNLCLVNGSALGSAQERGNGFILVSVMGFPEHFVEDAHAFSSADGNGCHRLSHALSNTVEQRVLSKEISPKIHDRTQASMCNEKL